MILTNNFQPPSKLTTPVLFLVFNRPNQSRVVFESIRNAKPTKLFFASDGPRGNVVGEFDRVREVRELVNQVDWDCEVFTLFRDTNLGCKYAVSGAINWFFENVEEGIILEDDCLPSQSFFWYCQYMLEKYRVSDDIAVIGGTNFDIKIQGSYSFTNYPIIWGWASWANIWKNYDVEISSWPINRASILKSHTNIVNRRFWENTFDNLYNNKINTWDYQLAYLLQQNGLKCIIPKYNLISNIGFGIDATHTFETESFKSRLKTYEINFEYELHEILADQTVVDSYLEKFEFVKFSVLEIFIKRIKNKLKFYK